MTKAEKESIRHLRATGLGYKAIATRLVLSVDAVKSFCQRNGLTGTAPDGSADTCQQCGKLLGERLPGAEGKKFCCFACRMKWWNRHTSLREPKEKDRHACVYCGLVFFSAKAKKYCGRPCYLASRFGGDSHDAGAI